MSATNRGSKREANDFYPTSAWCVEALLNERSDLIAGCVLEPAVGDGAIVQAVDRWYADEVGEGWVNWTTNDITIPAWLANDTTTFNRDFLTWVPDRKFDVIITNPPFNLALEFIQHSLELAPVVIMLLRLNFLGSQKRAKWLRDNPASIYILPKRPTFTKGGSDNCEYAWFVWSKLRRLNHGTYNILEVPESAKTTKATRSERTKKTPVLDL